MNVNIILDGKTVANVKRACLHLEDTYTYYTTEYKMLKASKVHQ